MNGPLVAIIDDDEALCSSLVDLVRSIGYRAEPFIAAETLLASPERSFFACVVADVRMPGMNGLDLARKLQEEGDAMSVILITALPDRQLDDQAMSAGARWFFRKPLETQALLDCVERSLSGKSCDTGAFDPPSGDIGVRPPRRPRTAPGFGNWEKRSQQWGCLMAAAQGGESHAYEQLLRELDGWLRRYYGRRLSGPAAEDAAQDALLAIHAKRHAYVPSRPFGPWVAAIARYKWIDHLRDASRLATLPLHDEIPVEDHGETAISAITVNDLLCRLTPAQASVIRLVKLQGASIQAAAGATGQSAALVKVNIHRGLRKLAALATGDRRLPLPSARRRIAKDI
jgi:RNA polymerase sigma-70 factor (ECF subfamily)